MSTNEDEFFKKLRATYEVEAQEHIQTMSAGLLGLEKDPDSLVSSERLESVFRAAHSLKGAARAVNFTKVEKICQALETAFAAWRRSEISPTAEDFDTLHRVMDLLKAVIRLKDGASSPDEVADVSAIVMELEQLASGRGVSDPNASPGVSSRGRVLPSSPGLKAPTNPVHQSSSMPDTIRVSTAKLDQLVLLAEELLTLKQIAAQRVVDLRQCDALCERWSTEWTRAQPHVRRLRAQGAAKTESPQLPRPQGRSEAFASDHGGVLSFLDWNLAYIKSLHEKLRLLTKSAAQDQHASDGLLDGLLDASKDLVMMPFSALSDTLPILVRDLSRDQGKDVDLIVHGGDVELDKRILEHLKDPFIHLIRNCVDHGVEMPEDRVRSGKPARATIRISVERVQGKEAEILVSDDGAGISLTKIREAALKGGTSTAELQQLKNEQVLDLVFQSAFSTTAIITEISGRGLGLAIVREKIEKLGGGISVETQISAGTTFRILLPITLATYRGLLVKACDQTFVIPASSVDRVSRIRQDSIKTVENRETIELNGRAVSLAGLAAVLELPTTTRDVCLEYVSVVVLSAAEEQIAFSVDEIVSEEEVLVKALRTPLRRVRNISGATTLGSGQVVPVLNVSDLMKSALRKGFDPKIAESSQLPEQERVRQTRILLAEDSITSRMLLKNIMESAGHHVTTAVDGLAALTELRSREFDLVVSDVEMPRMNGFDLIRQIRSDRNLKELPIILVTALASREDREQGIDVGANAYIVKSSFDQSNLLDAIRRLV